MLVFMKLDLYLLYPKGYASKCILTLLPRGDLLAVARETPKASALWLLTPPPRQGTEERLGTGFSPGESWQLAA